MDSIPPWYSDEDYMDSYNSCSAGEMEVRYEIVADGDSTLNTRYTILTEERIRQLQDKLISEVSSVLCVSRGLACTLLLQTNWDPNLLLEKWLADEERIRESVGLLAEQESLNLDNYCKICCQKIKIENMLSAPCGRHPFCPDCWRDYISASINNDGPGCLKLGCPKSGCKAIVGLDMVDFLLLSDYDKDRYYQYLLWSYVEGSYNLKRCPAPGCRLAVQFNYCGSYDVTCDCSYRFCWNCLEENHHPIICEIVDKWCKDNASQAEDIARLVSYIKPCPKCRRNTEKNQGSNHMTCGSPCGFEFCWLCLSPWTNSHTCNKYEDKEGGKESLEEPSKKYLEVRAHYYERWDSNHKSREIARANLNWARNELTNDKWMVVIGALERIVECRNVLKWGYANGYYFYLTKTRKMEFIVFLEGQAEAALEMLHHFVETEVERCLKADCPRNYFENFRLKLISLSNVTRKHIQN